MFAVADLLLIVGFWVLEFGSLQVCRFKCLVVLLAVVWVWAMACSSFCLGFALL